MLHTLITLHLSLSIQTFTKAISSPFLVFRKNLINKDSTELRKAAKILLG